MDLLQVMKLNKLHCKIIKWADDKTANPDLRNYFQFTGLESRIIGHYICQLISALQTDNDARQQQLKLHALSTTMVELRDAVALFSRYILDDSQMIELKQHC